MSVKSLDREGRWRDITIGFRVSEEENERINQLAALSGMTKQAFIIDRLEGNEITVLATTRVQKALATSRPRGSLTSLQGSLRAPRSTQGSWTSQAPSSTSSGK